MYETWKDHEYVVKLFDNFQFTALNGFRYHALILEYLPGGDLAQFFEKMLNNGMYLRFMK